MCPQILFFYIVTSHLPTIIETTRLLLTEASYLTSVAFELKLKGKKIISYYNGSCKASLWQI